jgi:hypothetical protein
MAWPLVSHPRSGVKRDWTACYFKSAIPSKCLSFAAKLVMDADDPCQGQVHLPDAVLQKFDDNVLAALKKLLGADGVKCSDHPKGVLCTWAQAPVANKRKANKKIYLAYLKKVNPIPFSFMLLMY